MASRSDPNKYYSNLFCNISSAINGNSKYSLPLLTVQYTLQFNWLSDVRPSEAYYDGNFIFYQEWIDSRLSWNSSDDSDVIQIPRHMIWTPGPIINDFKEPKESFFSIDFLLIINNLALLFPSYDKKQNIHAKNGVKVLSENQKVSIHGNGKVVSADIIAYTGILIVAGEYYPYDVHYCLIGTREYRRTTVVII